MKDHVVDDQPLYALFTASMDEVKKRVVSGSKWAGRKRPHPEKGKAK